MRFNPTLFSFVMIVFIGISSCQESIVSDDKQKEIHVDQTENLNEPLEVNDEQNDDRSSVEVKSFSEFPDEVDGCACYYGRDKSMLTAGNYVFMTDYDKLGFMFLDGEMRTFKLISSNDIEGGKLEEIWSNNNFKLTITTSQTGQIDETWQHAGSIEIKPTDKKSTSISILGECGC